MLKLARVLPRVAAMRMYGYRVLFPVTLALLLLGAFAGAASGQDPSAGLADAESKAATAKVAVDDAEARLRSAEARYAAMTRRAAPAKREARAAQSEVDRLQQDAEEHQRSASAEIAQIESDHAQAVDDHDEQVNAGIAIALAAALIAALALAWDAFRASAAVTRLADLPQGRAVGLCVGAGALAVIVGAALADAGGFLELLGLLLFLLGFVLATAFLLARHSVQIQRGQARPLLKRERTPEWVNSVLAGAMALVSLLCLGGAIFSDQPAAEEIPRVLREEAAGKQSGGEAKALAAAEAKAMKLQGKAGRLGADQAAARRALGNVRRGLNRARRELTHAERDTRYYAKRLAAQTRREEREAEEREIEDEEADVEPQPSGCDPNYGGGCVPLTGYDVDCAEVSGPVEVVGVDVHGLDADNDGIGCE